MGLTKMGWRNGEISLLAGSNPACPAKSINNKKKGLNMGFKKGTATHTHGIRGVHSFRNDPDKTHQTCTRCGCKKVITYNNADGKTTHTYYDRNGNKLNEIPSECKGLWDLLNAD